MNKPQTLTAKDFGRVAVFMGGWSAERDISLKSGAQVLQGLQAAGVDATGIDVSREWLRSLSGDEYDRVFMILHGPGGEDGIVQAHLEMIGMPYTGSDVLGSALAMNKYRSKLIWHGLGMPTPEWRWVKSSADCYAAAASLGLPMMLKPINEGSSIGVTRVMSEQQIETAFAEAQQYGAIMAEQFIEGHELTVSIVAGEALPVIKIETPRDFYDYQAKYFVDSTGYQCPANIPDELARECQSIALQAFAALGGRDWGRVDFMCDEQYRPWLIEANTAPGMTDHSLVPMAAREVGMDFETLVCRILACSVERS